jgi:hypothetical protein
MGRGAASTWRCSTDRCRGRSPSATRPVTETFLTVRTRRRRGCPPTSGWCCARPTASCSANQKPPTHAGLRQLRRGAPGHRGHQPRQLPREVPAGLEACIALGPEGEGTAWSCSHGVGRWRRDCGCSARAGRRLEPEVARSAALDLMPPIVEDGRHSCWSTPGARGLRRGGHPLVRDQLLATFARPD